MMDPIALKALAYFPLPNAASTSITETNNWFGQGISQSVNRQMSIKMDQNFSERSRLNGRYSYGPYTQTPPTCSANWAPPFHSTTARSSAASIPSSPSSPGRRVRQRSGACATG